MPLDKGLEEAVERFKQACLTAHMLGRYGALPWPDFCRTQLIQYNEIASGNPKVMADRVSEGAHLIEVANRAFIVNAKRGT